MKTMVVTAGVIIQEGKVLITQRKEDSPRGLLWEFPGGKIKQGEEPRDALQRELKEELGIEVRVETILETVFHTYPDCSIVLLAYYCRIEKGTPRPLGCRDLQWVSLEELEGFDMAAADDPIRKRLSPDKTQRERLTPNSSIR